MHSVVDLKQDDTSIIAGFVGNILDVYENATDAAKSEGLQWYAQANADAVKLASDLGISADSVMGAAAAISPGMRWSLVIAHVGMLYKAMIQKQGHRVPTYSKLFVERARRILRGEAPLSVLRGPKVTAFYQAIRDAGGAVVVDGHAFNIARGARSVLRGENVTMPALTSKRFKLTVKAYEQAAAIAGIEPHQMQAVTWMAWRDAVGVAEKGETVH